MKKLIAILFFIVYALTSYAQQQEAERFAQVIKRLVNAMNSQNYATIVREYNKKMSTDFPLIKTTIFFKNMEAQYGKVIKVDTPKIKSADQAICTMFFERGTNDFTLNIDNQGKIKGFLFTTHVTPEKQPTPDQKQESAQPTESKTTQTQAAAQPTNSQSSTELKQTPPQPAKTSSSPVPTPTTGPEPVKIQPSVPLVTDKQKTELHPPFRGRWIVISGGESQEGAAQRNLLRQNFAYQFSRTDLEGLRYRKEGKANEDYFGYGENVLAPADGTVVEKIDGIRDNPPGLQNPYAPIGNAVIIKHSDREYSVLSFLKQGSISVGVGDRVKRGQVIGQCGNSGSATEPAIHYHLQDSPYLQTARGVKFYFERAMVAKEGKRELKLIHMPKIGEEISQ